MRHNKPKIAVIGATGNVGRKLVSMLVSQDLVLPTNLQLFASVKSAGRSLNIANHSFIVDNAETANFDGFDLCIFNTESDISQNLVPKALDAGAYVVDSSSHYRLDPQVPLIVPPVNKRNINIHNKLYAHANCLASPIATIIHPLHQHNQIRKVNVVTYQSTSGAGKLAYDECWNETAAIIQDQAYKRQYFKRQIAFNVIPQVGDIMDDGFTFEEYKIIHEVQKVVDQNIAITATAVRVPVLVGHSIVLTIEFSKQFALAEIIELLKHAPSVQLSANNYTTPIEVVNSDDVFVGRVRLDPSTPNGLHLWLCSDNLRIGAATDSVEIARIILSIL